MMRRAIVVVAALLALAVVIGVVVDRRRSVSEASGRAVLLAPADLPDSRLPVTPSERLALGIEEVSTFAEMQRSVNDETRAILIEAGSAITVDWAWIQQRLRDGALVVGININMSDLLRLLSPTIEELTPEEGLGWTVNSRGYSADRLFYSMIVSSTKNGCLSAAFDHFDSGVTSGLFKSRLLEKISCASTPADKPRVS